MTVTAQRGSLSVGPQEAKGTAADTLYKLKTYDIDFGAVDDNRNVPLEVGGGLTPTGAFKAGTFVAGGARLTPRLEGDFGWLLYAAMGSASDVANYGGEAGVYAHVFRFATDESFLPWVSIWKHIPGEGVNDGGLLVKGLDCKITSLDFTVPAAGLVLAELVAVGREPSWVEDPDLSALGVGDTEDADSLGITCVGHLKFDGTETVATQARVSIQNALTTPQEERIIGSYFPDDFVPRTRVIEVSFVYKWEDPDLYQRIMTNSTSGTEWSPIPTEAAFEVRIDSAQNIPTKNQPFSLIVQGPKVTWRMDGEPALEAGGIIAQRYVGTLQENPGGDYARVILINNQATYVWPTP
jgi:hypothetical protein